MKFACDRCHARYMIPDEKVRPGGVKVRCKKCDHIILVKPAGVQPAEGSAAPGAATPRETPAPNPTTQTAARAPVAGAEAAGAVAAAGEAPGAAAPSSTTAGPEGLDAELGAAFDSMVVGGAPHPDELAPPDAEQAAAGSFAGASSSVDEPEQHPLDALLPTETEDASGAGAAAESEPGAGGDWFLAINDEQVGPLGQQELQERWERAEIGPDTLCWRSGLLDWTPLSQISELAGVLAPLPSRDRRPVITPPSTEDGPSAEAPRREPWDNTVIGAKPAAAEGGWRPAAASALASLVEKEIEAAASAAPQPIEDEDPPPPAHENTGIRVLLRNLPDDVPAGEPSRFIPLQKGASAAAAGVAAVDATPTSASKEKAAVGGQGGGRRTSTYLAIGALLLIPLLAAGAWFGGFLDFGGSSAAAIAEAPAAAPVQAAVPQAPAPSPMEPPPAEAEGAVAAGGAGAGDGGSEAVAEGKEGGEAEEAVAKAPEEEKIAEPPEEPKPEPVKVAAAPKRTTTRPKTTQRAASSKPAAAPRVESRQQPSRGSSDLLAAGSSSSIDDLFNKEFSGSGSGSATNAPASSGGGSTYIPPAPGSGANLPAQLGQGDITAVVFGQKAELKRCATAYKASGGATSGTLVMRWSIEPNGRTSGVKPVQGAEHGQLASCIGDLVKGWKFPAYAGPKMAPIDFPFPF